MYTKFEALQEILELEAINTTLLGTKLTLSELLDVLQRDKYSFKNDFSVSESTMLRILKKIWPDKPANIKICTYLLSKYDYKYCTHCKNVLGTDQFHKNKARPDGYNNHCKDCCLGTRRDYQREYQATRKCDMLQRTAAWADLEAIKRIYAECPQGHHVDHIIPIRGELVSGLHVENNLQYLPATENIKKSNTFSID